ncbi:MAG: hypothetical protein ACYTG2_07355 [Planctomycetota bacterium]|jgi:hypothetical protein
MVVLGRPLWFESPDVPLRASVDPFISALLFPALHRRQRLASRQPVDVVQLDGLRSLLDTYSEWWQYPDTVLDDLRAGEPAAPLSERVGQCFSGGVDSYYRFFHSEVPVDTLVFVHGFDIALDDSPRWRHAEESFRRASAELSMRAVVVRTNLRAHPVFRHVSWEHAHGAALAAVGHALSGAIGTLSIPPSYRASDPRPWGSDCRTDPQHSSSRLRIVNPRETVGRPARLANIAPHPVVRHNLRVCWENRDPTGNCSRCEKCLLVMAILAGMGLIGDYPVFDRSVPLTARLDALPWIAEHARLLWVETLDMQSDPAVADALRRLLAREPPAAPRRDESARRGLGQRVARLIGRRRHA